MDMNKIDDMWNRLDKAAKLFKKREEKKLSKNTNLSEKEIKEKVRKKVDRKFREETEKLLEIHYNYISAKMTYSSPTEVGSFSPRRNGERRIKDEKRKHEGSLDEWEQVASVKIKKMIENKIDSVFGEVDS